VETQSSSDRQAHTREFLLLKLFLIIRRSLTRAPAEEPDRGAVDRPQNAQPFSGGRAKRSWLC
jgi:hypothetical protein